MNHLSHTQLEMFLRCPAQWMFRYIEKLKQPPSGPLAFGITFDDAMNVNYEQKIISDEDLTPDEVKDAFVTEFDSRKNDVTWAEKEKPEDFRAQGIDLVEQHMKDYAPGIHPLEVQPRIELQGKDQAYSIVTVPDIITRDNTIIDVKTTGKRPGNLETDKTKPPRFKVSHGHLLQASIYAVSFLAKFNLMSKATHLMYHIRKKASEILDLSFTPTSAEQSFAMGQIDRVSKALAFAKAENVFVPNRSHMMCSKKHCGYWDICHKRFGPDERVGAEHREIIHHVKEEFKV